MATATERFKEAKAKIEEAQATAKEVAKEAFAEMSRSIFEGHPTLESFAWQQYTPYFNDGDACYFRVNDEPDSIDINGESSYDLAEGHSLLPVGELVSDLLISVGQDQLEVMFGDHVEVTVKRDGTVDVSAYRHD